MGELLESPAEGRNAETFRRREVLERSSGERIVGTSSGGCKLPQEGENLKLPQAEKEVEPYSAGETLEHSSGDRNAGPFLRGEKGWNLLQAGENLETF